MNVLMIIREYSPELFVGRVSWNNAKVTESEEWHIQNMNLWYLDAKISEVLIQIKKKDYWD